MTYDLLAALALFAFVSSITPGPNNLMLMASGVNFGFRRTIPHMMGVGIGFVAMIILVGIGAIGLFETFPISHTILKVCAVLYLLWLAWKIATASRTGDAKTTSKPMTFWQAAAFQWVNPKAWTMALTAITVYAPDQSFLSLFVVAVVFGLINLPSVGSWTLVGQAVSRWLHDPRHLRIFNISMAVLLVLSLIPVVRA